jgi:phage terminase large subunit-like protein
LTSTPRGPRSLAAWLASRTPRSQSRFLEGLSDNATAALPYLFEFWGRADHQLEPLGDWTTWVVLGGRGSGKTRAGAEWIRAQIEGTTPLQAGRARRAALLAETWEQGRAVMIEGESGILACSPPDRRPIWEATKRRLVWPNGAEAHVFSAVDPESLRGPQFDVAWSDELAKWRKAEAAWDMLQFGLRLGDRPRQVVTTTPRNVKLLRLLLDQTTTIATRAPSRANQAFLAPGFLEAVTARYRDTPLGRQELEGELISDPPGALFSRAAIDAARVSAAPALDRVVVAVDPPATGAPGADECGIVVAGVAGEAVYVLDDRSVAEASPARWAAEAVEAWRMHDADRIVAEVNQGGDMVAETIRRADPFAPVAPVRASRSKSLRAEPVSLLYAQGRVRHVGHLPALEDQLCAFEGTGRSPDRVDALVWAVSELMAREHDSGPRIRGL